MQPLSNAGLDSSVDRCSWEVLNAALPLVWFIRRKMRVHRKGLSVPQFRALVQVGQRPQASLSAVGEHLGVSLPTASRIIAGLVNKGLIQRADSKADRRQISLEITEKGDAVLQAAWRATQDELAREVEHFTPAERNTIVQAMQLLKQNFGSLVADDGEGCSVNEKAMCSQPSARKHGELANA